MNGNQKESKKTELLPGRQRKQIPWVTKRERKVLPAKTWEVMVAAGKSDGISDGQQTLGGSK